MPFTIGPDQPLPEPVDVVIVSLGPGDSRDRGASELADNLVARGVVVAGATHFDALGPRMVLLVSERLVARDPSIPKGLDILSEEPAIAVQVVPHDALDGWMRDRDRLVRLF